MAVRSRGGSPGLTVALAVFGILFFLTLVATVVFLVQTTGLRKTLAAAQQDLSVYARPGEQADPRVLALKADRSGSVVGKLLEQRAWAFTAITGNAEAEFDAVQAAVKETGLSEGESLLPVLKRHQTLTEEAQRVASEQRAAINQLAAEFEQLGVGKKQQGEAFTKAVGDLDGRLQQQRDDFGKYEQTSGGKLTELASSIEQIRRQAESSVLELRQRNEQLGAENASLRQRIKDMVPSREGSGPTVDPSLLPDGHIVTIDPRGRWVYIDRGRRQHVVLGMSFEVFDQIARADDSGQLRGKATVLVVDIIEDSAQCQVVRTTPGTTVQEGDIIANLVYSPDATFNFYVYGDFDIENTGNATEADRRRLEEMIQQWGGKVQAELSYQTDFLVLGKQPPEPMPLVDVIDPVEIRRRTLLREAYNRYQELIQKAREMSIPVLNQNRFLTLVGYFERE
ncbi:MAG: hypothetical protein IT443_07755 [Phycisphaeraceae bacterium]|nr:hypothetical protein [Phycisphaeraceae bacterium]